MVVSILIAIPFNMREDVNLFILGPNQLLVVESQVLAAIRGGVKHVLLPMANERHVHEDRL